MTAGLSVIIPTLNAEGTLAETLEALMEGIFSGLIKELVISDGGSTDATSHIAEDVGAVFVQGPASRGGQLRRGCAVARGEWFLILHADTRLEPGWTSSVHAHLRDKYAAAYFRLDFPVRGVMPMFVVQWANMRAKIFGLPYGDQGLLIHKDHYHAVAGFSDYRLMEDVDMMRKIRKSKISLTGLPHRAITDPHRYERFGWFRTGASNLFLLGRYLTGTHPDVLNKKYKR